MAWKRDPSIQSMIDWLDQGLPAKLKISLEDWDRLPSSDKFESCSPSDRQAIMEQARDCSDDFSYAARNYFWITTKKKQDQLFTLWESQYLILQEFYRLKAMGKPQKLIIVKGRQLGCSTLIEAMIAWRSMFFPNTNAIVISVDQKHSSYLFGLMLHIYDKLPWWLKPMIARREEQYGLWFENPDDNQRSRHPGLNSKVFVQWSNQYSGVGQGIPIDAVHCSEFSDFLEEDLEAIVNEDLANSMADDPEVFGFMESTGRGAGTASHLLWRACERRLDAGKWPKWYPLFLPTFFETTRVLAPPNGWTMPHKEFTLRERVKKEWARCNNSICGRYQKAIVMEESMIGTVCPECKAGTLMRLVLTDEQLYWHQDRREQAEEQGVNAVKLLRQEHCIAGNMRVSTELGILPIGARENVGQSSESGEVSGWFDKGFQHTVIVETLSGRILQCTADHLILLESGDWKAAGDLHYGDSVRLCPPRLSGRYCEIEWSDPPIEHHSIHVDEDLGRFLGYFMGDGGLTEGGIGFACDAKDPDVADDIDRLVIKFTGHACCRSRIGGMNSLRSHDIRWRPILKQIGAIELWPNNKYGWHRKVRVPDCIWRSPASVVKEFLSALFECDGNADKNVPRTRFFSKFEPFIRDVQLLLLAFGINGTIHKEDKTNSEGRTFTGRCLGLGVTQSNRFHERVGFISDRKRSACIRPTFQINQWSYQHPMADRVLKVQAGEDCSVFDMEITPSHLFSANGFTVHNCVTSEESWQVSGYVLFSDACRDWMTETIEEFPLKKGKIYRDNGEIHGADPLRKGRCFVPTCNVDHRHDDTPFWVWEEPIKGATYSIAVDVSEGIGEDYSVIFVNKIGGPHRPDEQVAVFRDNHTYPKDLAFYANVIGKWYNYGEMAVEYNTYQTTGDDLLYVYHYPNVYRWKHKDKINPMSQTWHWWTKPNTKAYLHQTAVDWLLSHCWIIRSKNFFEETTTYRKEEYASRSFGAASNCNDDELMAGMISLYTAHELDCDETGRIQVPVGIEESAPARYRMTCLKCKTVWGAANPEKEYRCPNEACQSIRITGEPVTTADPRKTNLDEAFEWMSAQRDNEKPPEVELGVL